AEILADLAKGRELDSHVHNRIQRLVDRRLLTTALSDARRPTAVKGTTGEPTLELRSPWEGMRSFSVEWKGDGIEMTSESGQQTWVITPEGMVYTDKEWGPEKVYAQRRWKRISK
ncbi:MAG: hypothetical protein MK312_10685, partial [Roseibacillus sp.]|nr:hypothetical protein [Roseibacillus sp.]